MGIFGYLSKAHLDQAVPTGDVAAKVAILDEKIKTERENVERARRQLQQMDSQVEQALARTTDDKGTERSVQIRRGQQKERSALLAEIGSAQTRIARLNEERAPISAELRKVEAEVGPLKYVAALLYGDNPDQNILEKAVRFVIIMIVMVFDPLAVLMLIAVNQSTMRRVHGNEPNPKPKEEKASVEQIEDEPITVSVYASQIPAFQGTITVPEGSAQVTITPTPSSEATTEPAASEHQLELDFESGGSEPVAIVREVQTEPLPVQSGSTEAGNQPVEEVPFIDNTKVTDILPVPLGPLAQELRGTADSSIKEVLERPRTGRPERLQ
jgi:hypothetical protein